MAVAVSIIAGSDIAVFVVAGSDSVDTASDSSAMDTDIGVSIIAGLGIAASTSAGVSTEGSAASSEAAVKGHSLVSLAETHYGRLAKI